MGGVVKIFFVTVASIALAGCQSMRESLTPEVQQVAAIPAARVNAPTIATSWVAERLPGSQHPDLNGVWQVLNTANFNIEAHAAQHAMQLRPGPYGAVPAASVVAMGAVGAVKAGVGIVQNEGGKIPYIAEAGRARDENRVNWIDRDPEVKCYLPGVPRANYMDFPFQITQSDEGILIAYEYASAIRNVRLGEEVPDPDEGLPSWMGQSYARWDGDTLVVEVFGLNGEAWLDRSGNQLGADAHVVERWTKTSPYTMRYEATITDAVNLTEPLRIAFNLYKRTGEDAQLQKFKCVEFVEELIYGHLRKNPLRGPALERALAEAKDRGQDLKLIVPSSLPDHLAVDDLRE